MKRKGARWSVLGSLLFFLTISLTATFTITIYAWVDGRTGGDRSVVALVMLLVIVFLSVVCTVIDIFRRRMMVDKPVEQILLATEKIAAGDFSVRLHQSHGYTEYDEYDCIMENLNLMAQELGKSELLKSDFISNVSHELKTPLAVIKSYALLLQREEDAQKRKEYAETVMKASQRLSDLVTNILKLSKLENEKIQPDKGIVRLHESIAESIIGFEDSMEKKNIRLECDLDELEIYSSQGYLEIVWNNLLSNAVKFTDEGGSIEVKLKKEGDFAVVSVKDTGCGISPQEGARIFDKFYQADGSHAQEGNGLGLALVKKVIDILGGEISVESTLGKGTTFTVVFHLAA